ncbi:hypothetical protein BKA81DRAFT_197160 [Phyllosticta paracitricarpa]
MDIVGFPKIFESRSSAANLVRNLVRRAQDQRGCQLLLQSFELKKSSAQSALRIPPSLCPKRQIWRSTLVVDSGLQLINVGGLQGYCPERSDAGTESSRKSLGRRWKRVTARILSFCNILDGLSEQSSNFESNPPSLGLQSAQSREARAQSWGMRPFQRKRPSRSARPTRASRHEHVLLALNEQKRSAA